VDHDLYETGSFFTILLSGQGLDESVDLVFSVKGPKKVGDGQLAIG
jgi:hypothetical protein